MAKLGCCSLPGPRRMAQSFMFPLESRACQPASYLPPHGVLGGADSACELGVRFLGILSAGLLFR